MNSRFYGIQDIRSVCLSSQVLQLEDVRGQVVGQDGSRGISGGQRKRVNLGLELVAAPALLLLGELCNSAHHSCKVAPDETSSSTLGLELVPTPALLLLGEPVDTMLNPLL